MVSKNQDSPFGAGTFVAFALLATVTFGWLVFFPMYLLQGSTEPLDALGFAFVVFATSLPPVFVWLVVFTGYIALWISRQNAQTASVMMHARRSLKESQTLGQAILGIQTENQRRADLKVVDLILKDMNTQLALIMERVGMVESDQVETLWALSSAGNPWIIPATFVTSAELTGDDFQAIVSDRLAGDSTATVALQNFLTRYEQMMRLLDIHVENQLIKEIVGDSPFERVIYLLTNILHRLYARLQEQQASGSGSASANATGKATSSAPPTKPAPENQGASVANTPEPTGTMQNPSETTVTDPKNGESDGLA